MPDNFAVVMLDQRRLPDEEVYLELTDHEQVADAIEQMVIRGAPAIGIAGAYGMVLAARRRVDLGSAAERLVATRPTAVNLAWGVRLMQSCAASADDGGLVDTLADRARTLHREDVAANHRLGRLGAERMGDVRVVLTHCNAGALATGGFGTALGVIRAAREAGAELTVLADETRPFLQGSRLTAWELARDGVPVEVITDGSAAWLLAQGEIDAVIVGSDRIARNGDVANKIGTYGVACLAQLHERPFYVAAPWSTVDEQCPRGEDIPVELRDPAEVTQFRGARVVPAAVSARNPVFDVTPARLVTAIFTERGVIEPVGPKEVGRYAGGNGASGSKGAAHGPQV
jgi:methylthioribose-1-phosphate isomerase